MELALLAALVLLAVDLAHRGLGTPSAVMVAPAGTIGGQMAMSAEALTEPCADVVRRQAANCPVAGRARSAVT